MAASQQPPQQPIYATELNFLLERHFARFTSYIDDRFRGNDARIDGIITQISVDRHESQIRDDTLLKRIEGVEATQKVIIDMQRDMISTMQAMQQAMQAMQQESREMRQEMRDGFAAQAERHNELMVRVDKIEKQLNPPKE